jgi:hypothetical protein
MPRALDDFADGGYDFVRASSSMLWPLWTMIWRLLVESCASLARPSLHSFSCCAAGTS